MANSEPLELTITPTPKIVDLVIDAQSKLTARVWQGTTKNGVPVHCYVLRVAVDRKLPDSELTELDAALRPMAPMREELQGIPLRLIL